MTGAVLLAWQIVIQPFVQRAPVAIAVRIAPGSPTALGRAAEAELSAGRADNAAFLGREALSKAPFNSAALRVVGLAEARAGRTDLADSILTVAGNWSLRDDPTHAWLVERRLRRGDYRSAFAHADTLARRRVDVQPRIFQLYTVASLSDARAVPYVAELLALDPPWREAYLSTLLDTPEHLTLAATLAMMLQRGRVPLKNNELQKLYTSLLDKGQVDAVRLLRTRLGGPESDVAIVNGGFDDPDAAEPFQWLFMQKAGAAAGALADDLQPNNTALRIEYDGYTDAVFVRQHVVLQPARYRLKAKYRAESGSPSERLAWMVLCARTGDIIVSAPAIPQAASSDGKWAFTTVDFTIPAGCPSQLLDLRGVPRDRRDPMSAWFDDVTITRLQGQAPE